MPDLFDAYHKWLGIPPEEQPPDHYRLLGIKRFESDVDVISHAADQRMAHVRSLQSGQHAKLSQHLLNEISNARVCLLHAEQKAKYDAELVARLKPTKKLAKAKPLPKARPAESAGIGVSAEAPSTFNVGGHRRRKSSAVFVVTSAAVVVGMVAVVAIVLALRPDDQPSDETAQAEQRRSGLTDPVKPQPAETPMAVSPESSTTDLVAEARPEAAADSDVEPLAPASEPVSDPPAIDVAEPKPPVEPPKPSPPEAAGVEPPPNPEAADVRLPIPNDAAQRAALQLVRDVFEADSKNAQTPEERAALAERMIQAAADTKDDPTTKFVLLRVARDMAAAAGNVELAGRVVDRLAELHQFDTIEMKIQTLAKAGEAIQEAEARKAFVATADQVLDETVVADRYDLAVPFATSLVTLARRTADIDLIKGAVAREREIEALAKEYEPVKAALDVLEANPSDAAANLLVGRYRCFIKGDWEGGLPYLAVSSDAGLKTAAEQELMQPASAEDQAKLGDTWWDLAEEEDETAKGRLQQRAAYWYRLAAPELAGLAKTKVDQRIAALEGRVMVQGAQSASQNPDTRHPTLGYDLKAHPDYAIRGGDHFYYAIASSGISWTAAQERCKAMGGYLACVESAEEQRFLQALARGRRTWIGGSLKAGNHWRWINGVAAKYANWARGQPDNKGGGIPEDCLMLTNNGKWNDSIDKRRDVVLFICEWEF